MSVLAFSQKSDSLVAEKPMPGTFSDPRIVIRKEKRTLESYDGEVLKKDLRDRSRVCSVGRQRDRRRWQNSRRRVLRLHEEPQSKFHLSIGVSYPSTDDAQRGFEKGLITKTERDAIVAAIDAKKMPPQKTKLGGEIYIHGGGTGRDWTWGCVALKNEDIEEIFAAIPGRNEGLRSFHNKKTCRSCNITVRFDSAPLGTLAI
jgi:hypothetical protein